MLEITILKVVHAGEEEAKKLLPYIKDCHVYALEAAGSTENNAQFAEKSWENTLKAGVSRSKIKEKYELAKDIGDVEIKKYGLKELDYLARQGRKLYFVERFTPEESTVVWQLRAEADTYWDNAQQQFLLQNFAGYYSNLRKNLCTELEIDLLRDQEIAKNMASAENRIRTRYPEFSAENPLMLAVRIGARHSPEKYLRTSPELKIIIPPELVKENDGSLIVTRKIYQLDTLEPSEFERLAIAYGICNIFNFPEQEAEKMDTEELKKMLKERIKKKR